MDIKPIKTKSDYRTALEEIGALMHARPRTRAGDRLEVLVTLVEAYEAQHFPLDLPDPVAAIRYVMESKGLSVKDLEPMIGRSNRVYEVLGRKRPLTLRSAKPSMPSARRMVWSCQMADCEPEGQRNCEITRSIRELAPPAFGSSTCTFSRGRVSELLATRN